MWLFGILLPVIVIVIGIFIYKAKSDKSQNKNGDDAKKNSGSGWMWAFIILLVSATMGIIFLSGKGSDSPQLIRAEKPLVWAANPTQVEAPDSAWTGFHSLPSGKFRIAVKDGEDAEVLFSDGKYYLLNSNRQIDFGRVSGKAKFRGLDKKVTIQIYSAE